MKDKTGKLIGFEIDVAARMAEDMGVKGEFVSTKWSGIIPALLTGKFDVIIAGSQMRIEWQNAQAGVAVRQMVMGRSPLQHGA